LQNGATRKETEASASQSDVQTAVAMANDGDTVVIPATSVSGIHWNFRGQPIVEIYNNVLKARTAEQPKEI
jgi:hypothetical protein